MRELLRLLPRLVGLIAGLSGDPRVSRRAKTTLGLAAAYLASPVDLVPDFLPVVGYLDDAIVAAIVLDGILSHVDRAVVLDHWKGDQASLERVARVTARVTAWVPRRWKTRVFGSAGTGP